MSRRSLLRLRALCATLSAGEQSVRTIGGKGGHISSADFFSLGFGSKLSRHTSSVSHRPTLARRNGAQSSLLLLHQPRRSFLGDGAPAKHHHERKLLGYTQQQLYDVVAAVEQYNEFVPWCQRSVIIQKKPPDFVEAELEVGFKMFVERYSSQVYLTAPSKVLSKVSDSTLFDHLDTTWEFKSGPTPSTTWLSFDIDFAFKSPLYRQIASIFFDEVVKRMMSAFEGRCRTLYGESSLVQKRKMQA